MINLKNSTTDLLSLITATGADISVVASWVDDLNPGTNPSSTSTDLMTPDRTVTNITTAATTTIVGTPAASTVRNVKTVFMRNIDVTSNTLTLQYSVGGTLSEMCKFILAAGEWAIVNDSGTLFVYNSDGSVKTQGTATGLFVGSFLHTDTANHTTGPNTHTIKFTLVGGGGGGAGVAANNNNMAASGGGSGGGYTQHVATVTPSTAYAYTTGAAGAAAANNAVGGNGGNTNITIGANIWTAQGGVGGQNMVALATNIQTTAVAQTAANTANSPLVSMAGEAGGAGWRTNGMVGHAGDGGASVLGVGGRGYHTSINTNGQTVGANGANYGGGGAGGIGTNGNANGGNGAIGVVIIEEYT